MFALRSVCENDLEDLFELSSLVFFINLPNDKKLIKQMIESSIKAFEDPSEEKYKNYYIFVLEDIEINKVVGVSMIHAQHGYEQEPHFFLKIGQERKFSQSLNTGFIHGTLKLGYDTDGPTEIGGLVLHPDYRGSKNKLGKQLSFSRFLYMAKFPKQFKETIHSELMPPLDSKGNSPLWEAIGRRFLNMNYQEADKLSRENKEFILNLFPSGLIYQTLLPLEARDAIGKVGRDTEPVKKMLEKIGFKYMKEVDPFDGGPHYRAELKNIDPIKKFFEATVSFEKTKEKKHEFLITTEHEKFSFVCLKVKGVHKKNKLIIEDKHRLLKEGASIQAIPF